MLAVQISNLHSQIGDALTGISGVLGCSAPFQSSALYSMLNTSSCRASQQLRGRSMIAARVFIYSKRGPVTSSLNSLQLTSTMLVLANLLSYTSHSLLSSARLGCQSMLHGINTAACPTLFSLFQRPVREQERVSDTESPEPP